MKKISKLLIATLFIAAAASSCKKSSNSPSGGATSMKLTSNGTAISFNSCFELSATVGADDHIVITGENINGKTISDNNVEIEIIHSLATLKAGQTYSVGTAFAQPNSMGLYYSPNASDTFSTQPGNPQGSVTITEVTATTIKGTFSAKLFAEDDFTGTTVKYTIAGGEFVAKITN